MVEIKKEFFYSDDGNDDFAGVKRKTISVNSGFKYLNGNPLWHLAEFFVYDIIMRPFAAAYCLLKFGIRFKGTEKLAAFKRNGYFLYGNHTQIPGDAFIANMLTFPQKPYFIVHPDNVSLKGTKNIMQMLGAVPLPNEASGYRGFLSAVKYHCDSKNAIVIYPEAHIWPYYTGIRPFKSGSFKYPVKFGVPLFGFTVTYQKRKFRKTPKITVFVDGPFYPDENLSPKENEKFLEQAVRNAMLSHTDENTCEFIKYTRVDGNESAVLLER